MEGLSSNECMRRVWLAACLVWLGVGVACAQTPPSQGNESQWKQTPEGRPAAPQTQMNCTGGASKGSDGKWTTTSNCGPAQDQPVPSNAAQQFPYPGDADAAKQSNQTPNAPGASGTQQAPKNAAQQFPYPGDDSEKSSSSSRGAGDAKPAPPGGLQDAGSTGDASSSSSSSSGYSSSGADQPSHSPDEDDEGVPTKTRASRKRPAEPVKTNSQQFAEDMQVASFYQNDGNFRAAYMRAKEAVSLQGDDPDAHLALAEAARKLGKLDEAEQNYKRCLELDPVPKTRKAAQAALKEMTGGGE